MLICASRSWTLRFLFLSCLILVVIANKDAAYKYSRQANEHVEDAIINDDVHHGHLHDSFHSHGHGHAHSHGHSHGPAPQMEYNSEEERIKYREKLHRNWYDDDDDLNADGSFTSSTWFQALASTALISVAPFVILFFVTVSDSEDQQNKLRIMLSFASGGLLGDAFLHLIPHAMEHSGSQHTDHHSHGHQHSHDQGGHEHVHDLTVGIGILSGIVSFLFVEKAVKIYCQTASASTSAADVIPVKVSKSVEGTTETDQSESQKCDSDDEQDLKKEADPFVDEAANVDAKCSIANPQHSVDVSGFLNLFADFFHNFTDGLAIGVSYRQGRTVGLFTTLTVLLHEVPHEIGDYAILVKSGMPSFKAKLVQLVTAVGALAGCVIALAVDSGGDAADSGSVSYATQWITPFTAGGFIYIASVSVLPELIQAKSSTCQALGEILALLTGVFMMVVVAKFE